MQQLRKLLHGQVLASSLITIILTEGPFYSLTTINKWLLKAVRLVRLGSAVVTIVDRWLPFSLVPRPSCPSVCRLRC